MDDKLERLIGRIKELERELRQEVRRAFADISDDEARRESGPER